MNYKLGFVQCFTQYNTSGDYFFTQEILEINRTCYFILCNSRPSLRYSRKIGSQRTVPLSYQPPTMAVICSKTRNWFFKRLMHSTHLEYRKPSFIEPWFKSKFGSLFCISAVKRAWSLIFCQAVQLVFV
jgi:hypothetical protein